MKTIIEIKVIKEMDEENVEEYYRLTEERRKEIEDIWKVEFSELILNAVGEAEVTVKTKVEE